MKKLIKIISRGPELLSIQVVSPVLSGDTSEIVIQEKDFSEDTFDSLADTCVAFGRFSTKAAALSYLDHISENDEDRGKVARAIICDIRSDWGRASVEFNWPDAIVAGYALAEEWIRARAKEDVKHREAELTGEN
jgi:hypothetical protein